MKNTFDVKIGTQEPLTLQYARRPGEGYMGERIVEVPIAVHFIQKWIERGFPIVEVGNVIPQWLDRYGMTRTWPVWDLFDATPGVIQKDVTDGDYHGMHVICVSTLEHVGREEYGNTKTELFKCNVAFDKIISEADDFLITIPIGYNTTIDQHAAESGRPTFIMKQTKPAEEFTQIDVTPDAWKCAYGTPFPLGNVIAFIYGKEP